MANAQEIDYQPPLGLQGNEPSPSPGILAWLPTIFTPTAVLKKKQREYETIATRCYEDVRKNGRKSMLAARYEEPAKIQHKKVIHASGQIEAAREMGSFFDRRRWGLKTKGYAKKLHHYSKTTSMLVAHDSDAENDTRPQNVSQASAPLLRTTKYELERIQDVSHESNGGTRLGYPRDVRLAIEGSLVSIKNWMEDANDTNRIYWLWHQGSGKDQVFRRVADLCTEIETVPFASFFFPLRPTAAFSAKVKSGFASTIAQDLATRVPGLQRQIDIACVERKHLIIDRSIVQQFKTLLQEPYNKVCGTRRIRLLLILDGFDRCPQEHMDDILKAFDTLARVKGVPIYFLISSERTPLVTSLFDVWRMKPHVVEEEYRP